MKRIGRILGSTVLTSPRGPGAEGGDELTLGTSGMEMRRTESMYLAAKRLRMAFGNERWWNYIGRNLLLRSYCTGLRRLTRPHRNLETNSLRINSHPWACGSIVGLAVFCCREFHIRNGVSKTGINVINKRDKSRARRNLAETVPCSKDWAFGSCCKEVLH